LSEEKTHQGIAQADMYQLFAYGTKYENCKEMYLIYPYDEVEEGNFYNYYKNEEKLNLKVLFFDVSLEKTFELKS